jgi:hypothetical protein
MTVKRALSRFSLMAILTLPLSATPIQVQSALAGGVPVDAVIIRSGATAAKVSKIRAVPSIGVVNLRFVAKPRLFADSDFDTIDDYRLTVERNYAGVKRLRAALRNNPATRRALAEAGISVARIVAADVSSNGSLRVYVL